MLIGLALAPALPAPGTLGDVESGVPVPARPLDRLPRSTHEHAWHPVHVATPPLPSTLADPVHRAAHRFPRYRSKTDRAAAKPMHPRRSHP
jgi:hypothetical protein